MSSSFLFLSGGVFFTGIILSAICYILSVIGLWRIFTRAGEKGWKSLIPFYNLFVQFKFSWKAVYFWPYLALGLCFNFFFQTSGSLQVLGDFLAVAYFIAMILTNYHLARSFGKGKAFTAGLVLLEPIFIIILGFGGYEYVGPMGVPKKGSQTPA